MVQTGRPVIVKDTAQDSRWVPTDNWLWLKCYVSAPILVTGETVGFLNVTALSQISSAPPTRSG